MRHYFKIYKNIKRSIFLGLLSVFALNLSCKKEGDTKMDEISENVSIVEKLDINRIEPLNWWVGFKNSKLQLLVHHPNISGKTVQVSYQGISIEKVHKADSPNYLFIDLNISESTKSGKFNIIFKEENKEDLIHTYELKSRKKSSEEYIGFNSSDAIYLITPDRFANGNPENDIVEGLHEKIIDRNDDYARHGGDIQGITNHLDYIEELGFTAVWPTPLLSNDMPQGSYHGYAMTNFYEIDPRFGTLEEYKELSAKLSKKGMKLIMDQVANHCGLEHWWMKDLPFKNWINHQQYYESNMGNWDGDASIITNHRRTTNQDRYASKVDKENMNVGWFVSAMPDLNQRNAFMAKYTIQNSIWWIETANLGGIRQDTYPYPDKDFMSRWAGEIMNEYPNFSIVGEEWSYNPLLVGYWQDGANNRDGYKSNLKSPMDFPMQNFIVEALNEDEEWDKGLVKMYQGLANDFYYASPKDLMVFPDNHDMSRIFTQLKGDVANTKMALSYLLALPRIPQIYYGTEILMNDFDKPGDHGLIRSDFPGGWEGDQVNAFTGEGLSEQQKDMQIFLKKLLNYRKNSKAIHDGKTLHFAPENGVYVLFRSADNETVIHIINKNDKPIELDLNRFRELGLKGKAIKNIITDYQFFWGDNITLNGKGSLVLTTKLD
ncbi:alpha-amlyase [Algibacter amylolyticus]|uniref:Alpha-amlyase n=1 Tax=Algibacter amylolyticus TaxID=1608400 RepID=A0A5M7BID7_9FLAO|nr:glycoside hydrolase family 13 protein [Algibacter amylolyticus]KAA5828018.1 glycoside hydrolase family 13 protein [Algibacter amylolyticus]MBB5267261.1 glycosidase [Algibacter amylolyticus]TSJ82263.1 alpha-amlyase [Algibacter amylolyticus]